MDDDEKASLNYIFDGIRNDYLDSEDVLESQKRLVIAMANSLQVDTENNEIKDYVFSKGKEILKELLNKEENSLIPNAV